MITALLRGRSWQEGLWLAAAISLKVIPAFLLLFHVRHRDWRCLSACLLGFAVGFFLQAEDGIRDYKVTGVQTCALPILAGPAEKADLLDDGAVRAVGDIGALRHLVVRA